MDAETRGTVSQYLSSYNVPETMLDRDLQRMEYPQELDDAIAVLLEQPGVAWSAVSQQLRYIVPDLPLRQVRRQWKVLQERHLMRRNLHRIPDIHSLAWCRPYERDVSASLVNLSICRFTIIDEFKSRRQEFECFPGPYNSILYFTCAYVYQFTLLLDVHKCTD